MVKVFGYSSTTDDVLEGVNLRGQRILVTGVSAGLGVGDGAVSCSARRACGGRGSGPEKG